MPIVIEGMTRMHTMDATGKPIHMPRPKKKNQKNDASTTDVESNGSSNDNMSWSPLTGILYGQF